MAQEVAGTFGAWGGLLACLAEQLQVVPLLFAEAADEHQFARAADGQVGVPVGEDVFNLAVGQEGQLAQVVCRGLVEADGVAMDVLQQFVEGLVGLCIFLVLCEELLGKVLPREGRLCLDIGGPKAPGEEDEACEELAHGEERGLVNGAKVVIFCQERPATDSFFTKFLFSKCFTARKIAVGRVKTVKPSPLNNRRYATRRTILAPFMPRLIKHTIMLATQ